MILYVMFVFLAALYGRLFKLKPSGILGCGIFGGSFKSGPTVAILQNLKVLGIFNQSRGEDSCGYFNGDAVYKGVDKEKKWLDFVLNNGLAPFTAENPVFLGHTRKASIGLVNARNAHPWEVENELYMVHNGTLSNHWDLLKKYHIPSGPIFTDSEALATLLHREGVKVLEEYKGAAAIAFHLLEEPGTVRIFHGASKEWESDKELTEERPLFYMQGDEGCYFSSMDEPLEFIRKGNESQYDVPKKLIHNWVIGLENGEYTNKGWKIDRSKVPGKYYGYFQGYSGYDSCATGSSSKSTGLTIWSERDVTAEDGYVRYFRNRYVRHNDVQLQGAVTIAKDGRIIDTEDDLETCGKVREYYFHNGIMLKSEKAYKTIMDALQILNELGKDLIDPWKNFAKVISEYSMYPVVNRLGEARNLHTGADKYYLDGKLCSASFTPKFSNRTYKYKDGNLMTITYGTAASGTKPPDSGKDNENTSGDSYDMNNPEFRAVKEKMYKVYKGIEDLRKDFWGVAYLAVYNYVEEVIQEIAQVRNPDPQVVHQGVTEVFHTAISNEEPVATQMVQGMFVVDEYIKEAYAQTEGKKKLTI